MTSVSDKEDPDEDEDRPLISLRTRKKKAPVEEKKEIAPKPAQQKSPSNEKLLKSQNKQLQAKLKAAQKQIKALETSKKQMATKHKNDKDTWQKAAENLNEKAIHNKQNRKIIKNQLRKDFENRFLCQTARIKELTKQHADAEKQLKEKEKEIAKNNKEMLDFRRQLSSYRQDLVEMGKERKKLQGRVRDANKELAAMKKKVESIDTSRLDKILEKEQLVKGRKLLDLDLVKQRKKSKVDEMKAATECKKDLLKFNADLRDQNQRNKIKAKEEAAIKKTHEQMRNYQNSVGMFHTSVPPPANMQQPMGGGLAPGMFPNNSAMNQMWQSRMMPYMMPPFYPAFPPPPPTNGYDGGPVGFQYGNPATGMFPMLPPQLDNVQIEEKKDDDSSEDKDENEEEEEDTNVPAQIEDDAAARNSTALVVATVTPTKSPGLKQVTMTQLDREKKQAVARKHSNDNDEEDDETNEYLNYGSDDSDNNNKVKQTDSLNRPLPKGVTVERDEDSGRDIYYVQDDAGETRALFEYDELFEKMSAGRTINRPRSKTKMNLATFFKNASTLLEAAEKANSEEESTDKSLHSTSLYGEVKKAHKSK